MNRFDNLKNFTEKYIYEVIYKLSKITEVKRDVIYQLKRLKKMITVRGGFNRNPDLLQAHDCFMRLELIVKRKLNILETETIQLSRELESGDFKVTTLMNNDIFKQCFRDIDDCLKYFTSLTLKLKEFTIPNLMNDKDALFAIAEFVVDLFKF